MKKIISIIFLLICIALLAKPAVKIQDMKSLSTKKSGIKITFLELGSKGCIPCTKMEPILEEISKKYAGQVEVIFYDLKKKENRHWQKKYGIKTIPTQVFLDADGKEIFRHIGFYPQNEIEVFLAKQSIKPSYVEKKKKVK